MRFHLIDRTALDTNLKIEREWRTKLQEDSVKDKERIGAMQMELKHLEQLKKVLSFFLLLGDQQLLFRNGRIVVYYFCLI